jgi:hypothetical protein
MSTGIDKPHAAVFPGSPSDDVAAIGACGSPAITALFVSMAQRHPQGADAQYLQWHTLDHRPEQQRLERIKTSLRVVSTPACRAARAACAPQFEAVDHVMTYFFTAIEGLDDFNTLSSALRDAGRAPFILPPVQRGVYAVGERFTAPHIKLGSDVLPWMPTRGLYLLIERGCAAASALTDVEGVAGVWSGNSVVTPFSFAGEGQHITYCFLDDDPLLTAQRLRTVLKARWHAGQVEPLFAAPFYSVVPYEWDRYLP